MSELHLPAHLRYTTTHEWVSEEPDGTLTVGITDFGQDQLGPLVYVQLPASGSVLQAGTEAGVVESNKTAADVHAPVAGTVIAINEALADNPEAVNADAYGNWIFKLRPSADYDHKQLLDATGYAALIG